VLAGSSRWYYQGRLRAYNTVGAKYWDQIARGIGPQTRETKSAKVNMSNWEDDDGEGLEDSRVL
jgi:hypothetical protein